VQKDFPGNVIQSNNTNGRSSQRKKKVEGTAPSQSKKSPSKRQDIDKKEEPVSPSRAKRNVTPFLGEGKVKDA